ncbi:NFATC2-interacting -like [Paramuricea clavata]|uniref:NFATC2-interacting -like n=1 Tax=Paramuricea clavata TaxID=317549 RepID=A0A6S7IXN0_PARCT|nr:NFATC2-interacting -like [Paramuricea clavata]
MPPKRRLRGGSNSSNLFHYNNQVELTFKGQPKEEMLEKVTEVGDSGSDDDNENLPVLRKKGKKNVDTSSSSDSSSASDSDSEQVTNNEEDNVYEIADDDNDVGPRPLTPPPHIPHIGTSEFNRQAGRLSRTMGEKMRYLQYLQKEDTPSPVASWSDVVMVNDNYGTPNSINRKMTVRIRTRGGVERFQLKKNEKFEEIFNELAKKHNVNIDALSLSFTDTQGNFQTLKSVDTPSSVNLNVADIIDCVIVHSAPLNVSFENGDNVVSIKIQGSESDTVKQFKTLKNEPLCKIMQQYADFRQLPLAKLKFSFDGEVMTSEQSPDDLDMDDENVVDVQIK